MMHVPPEQFDKLRTSDIWLASYPRSGNTWTRNLVSDVILQINGFQTDTDLPIDIRNIVPDIYIHDIEQYPDPRLTVAPRIIKTHQYFETDQKPQRAVYLFREPADALCSYYHFQQRYPELKEELDKGIDVFCHKHLPVYQAHLESYIRAKAKHPDNLLFVSYEALHAAPFWRLQQVMQFCGVEVSPEICWRAVENHLFTKHKVREISASQQGAVQPFYRQGKVGSGRLEIAEATLTLIDSSATEIYRQAQALEQQDLLGHDASAVGDRAPSITLPISTEPLAPQKTLEQLCRPLPGNPTGRVWEKSAGVAAVLNQYAGLPIDQPLRGVVLPDLMLDETSSWEVVLNTPLPAIAYHQPETHHVLQAALQAKGINKRLFPLADPFVYVADLLKEQCPERRGVLFFPQQSTAEAIVGFDAEALARVVRRLEADDRPVTVCLGWKDINLGRHIPLQKLGLRVVSAGFSLHPQFLFRLHHLCSTHQLVASTEVGTPLMYAMYAGCQYVPMPSNVGTEDTASEAGLTKAGATKFFWVQQLRSRFNDFASNGGTSTTELLKTVEYFLGVPYFQPPAALRQQLLDLDALYTLCCEPESLLEVGPALAEQLEAIAPTLTPLERNAIYSFFANVWGGDRPVCLVNSQTQEIEKAIALGMRSNPNQQMEGQLYHLTQPLEQPVPQSSQVFWVEQLSDWSAMLSFLQAIAPHTQPGSYLIVCDYDHPEHFWVPLCFEQGRDSFWQVGNLGTARVFQLMEPLHNEQIDRLRPTAPTPEQRERVEQVFARLLDNPRQQLQRQAVVVHTLQYIAALAYLGYSCEARAEALSLMHRPWVLDFRSQVETTLTSSRTLFAQNSGALYSAAEFEQLWLFVEAKQAYQAQAEQLQAQLHTVHTQLQEEQEKLAVQQLERDRQQQLWAELLAQSQGRIAAMETSKFWQLRRVWFGFKRRFGLSVKED